MRLERTVVHVDDTASRSRARLLWVVDDRLPRLVEVGDSMVDESASMWLAIRMGPCGCNEGMCIAATGPIHDVATTAVASHARQCISCRLDTSMHRCRIGCVEVKIGGSPAAVAAGRLLDVSRVE